MVDRRLTVVQQDLTDSIIYAHLIGEIAPPTTYYSVVAVLGERTDERRAMALVKELEKLRIPDAIKAKSIVEGDMMENLHFLALLFHCFPVLSLAPNVFFEPVIDEESWLKEQNVKWSKWLNSFAVTPRVHDIFVDLGDGLVILQVSFCP